MLEKHESKSGKVYFVFCVPRREGRALETGILRVILQVEYV
jgi:hypothetical protein